MIKAFASSSSSSSSSPPPITATTTVTPSSSSSSNHYHQQHTNTNTKALKVKQEQQQQEQQHLATRIALRLSAYGMTDQVFCQCQECPFVNWSGYPIMRFVHPDHVQRLCAGLCEASKTGMAISISDIRCTIDSPSTPPLSSSSPSYDTIVHLTVHESHSVYICVLYYYPNDILKNNKITTTTTTTTTATTHDGSNSSNTNRQLLVLNLARAIMVASLVLLQLIFHYSYYLFPVKLLLRPILMLLLRSKKDS